MKTIRYSVLLLYPAKLRLDACDPTLTYYARVKAQSPAEAISEAQAQASKAQSVRQPYHTFAALGVWKGWRPMYTPRWGWIGDL